MLVNIITQTLHSTGTLSNFKGHRQIIKVGQQNFVSVQESIYLIKTGMIAVLVLQMEGGFLPCKRSQTAKFYLNRTSWENRV